MEETEWRHSTLLLFVTLGAPLPQASFFHPCTLLHFVSWDILENAFSPGLSVPLSHLKTLQRGDRNYQSAVHKVLSSSQNVLRSCFYILLLSHRHKSLGRTRQHLLHSPPPRNHSASPQARGHSSSDLFISPEWELLIPPVSLLPFLSFGFGSINITHLGPLHMIALSAPRSTWHGCEFGSLLVNCLKMVHPSFSYVTSTFP